MYILGGGVRNVSVLICGPYHLALDLQSKQNSKPSWPCVLSTEFLHEHAGSTSLVSCTLGQVLGYLNINKIYKISP